MDLSMNEAAKEVELQAVKQHRKFRRFHVRKQSIYVQFTYA